MTAQLGTGILCKQTICQPVQDDGVDLCKGITLYQRLRSIVLQALLHVQASGHIGGQFIITLPVQVIVHQAVKEGNDVPGFIGNEGLPSLGQLLLNVLIRIGDEKRHHQLFQRRLVIVIAKLLLTEFPEGRKQIILLKLCKEFVIFQLIISQQYPDHFVKGASTGTAHSAHKSNQYVFLVEILNLQIVEPACALFIGEKLDMLFNDLLVFLVNTQIRRQQGSTISKEALGVQHGILQVILPYIRLRKRSIDQVIGGLILTLQKILCGKLVAWFQLQNLSVSQLHKINVFCKIRLVIIPEYQLAGITGEFFVQPVYNLFQV